MLAPMYIECLSLDIEQHVWLKAKRPTSLREANIHREREYGIM
jgi:hypothetical protein